MNIDQTLVGSCSHYQKSFSFIAAFKRYAAERRHKNGLAVFPVDEVGLLLVAFLFPFKPTISETDSPAMLP
ncbi:hypothetical protein SB6417_01975 [Klebsiella pasteurii]|nr:hypothetical protein SB6417_01975 [Klebsiella pasteurii]